MGAKLKGHTAVGAQIIEDAEAAEDGQIVGRQRCATGVKVIAVDVKDAHEGTAYLVNCDEEIIAGAHVFVIGLALRTIAACGRYGGVAMLTLVQWRTEVNRQITEGLFVARMRV